MSNQPLQVALICPPVAAMDGWMKRLAERICAAPGLTLSALIEPTQAARPRTALGLWWDLESKLVARPVDAACPLFDQIQSDLPRHIGEGNAPDIIVDLTARRGRDATDLTSRFGVWWLDFLGDVDGARSVAAILAPDRLMTIGLVQKIPDDAEPTKLAEATLNTKFMAARNELYAREKSVVLILRELNRLSRDRAHPEPLDTLSPVDKMPSFAARLQYLAQFVHNSVKRVLEKIGTRAKLRPGFFHLQSTDEDPLQVDPNTMTVHEVPGNVYYADPFLWVQDGETYCFFEIYDYATGHGHLGAGRLVDGQLTDVQSIIKCDYHMSFPFLFEHEGDVFMLPETCAAERLEIWKCVEFPYRWERHKTVLDNVMAADSCVAQIGPDWWLFTNVSTDVFGELNSELHLYKADGPMLDSLEPHPLNPVIFDAATARNGGRVFAQNGVFYRASQRNSHGLYGYGINLMRIDEISMADYRETLIRRIDGDFRKGVIGCHHLDHREGQTVIDVRQRIGGRPKRRA